MISSLVLHEEAEPVFADKSTVYSRTVGHTLFTVGPAQISLLPYPLLHHPLVAYFGVVCVAFLYRTILDELFSMLSVMFQQIIVRPLSFHFRKMLIASPTEPPLSLIHVRLPVVLRGENSV